MIYQFMKENIKIKRITVLSDLKLLVEFQNNVTKIYDAKRLIKEYPFFTPLQNPELFKMAAVDYNGSGVIWNAELDVSEWELWTNGIELPLSADDFDQYLKNNSVGTAEACKLLNCTRQNIDFLTKRGKISPVMHLGNNKLFSRADIMAYKFKADNESYAKEFESLDTQ